MAGLLKLHHRKTTPDLIASKQGRMIDNINQDVEITLVDDTQGRMNKEDMFRVTDLDVDEVVVDVSAITTVGIDVTTAATTSQISKDEITLAQTLIEIKEAKPKAITTTATTITSASTRPKEKGITKDKGKAKMIEPEKPLERKDQDNTQAMMDVDCRLAVRLQEEERGELSIKEKSSYKAVEGSEKAKEGSSKRAASKLEQGDAKRQMIEEENESAELKRCMEIIPEDDDDMIIEATPLSSKSSNIVDYKIYKEGRKSYFKIIRAYVSPVASASVGAEGSIPPKTAEQKLARKNELKSKSTPMLAIPDEDLLKFHACKDAKSLWEAIKNSTNETFNTAYSVSVASFKDQASTASYANDVMFYLFPNQSNAPLLDNEDLEQIDTDDPKEMDLKWQVAMLTMRVKRFIKKIGRKLDLNGKETIGFDRIKVECYNCHRKSHFARECRAPRNQGNRNRDALTRNAPVGTSTTNSLVVQDEIGYQMGLESLEARIVVHEKNEAVYEEDIAFLKYDVLVKDISIKEIKNQLENALKEKDDLKRKQEKFETSPKNLTKLINSQISPIDKTGLGYNGQMNESVLNDIHVNESEVLDNVFDSLESDGDDNQVNYRFKKGEGYHAVPPPYTRNYMPSRADLSFVGLDNSVFKSKVSETITSVPKIETNASKTSKDSLEKPKTVRSSAPLIEEW
nr:hypothetical protein [Tanacetum cinerariifolium]